MECSVPPKQSLFYSANQHVHIGYIQVNSSQETSHPVFSYTALDSVSIPRVLFPFSLGDHTLSTVSLPTHLLVTPNSLFPS